MLTREENELLCRVGAGTPMGAMLRRYWMPAALCDDLAAGGAPKRVTLLGEHLVAFRDSAGAVGLLDENCPHRGASLAIARNEDCGLRCIYHGWKFDVTGRVLETPAEPDAYAFKDRVRAIAYPVHEAGGIVWAYLGPPEHVPPPMDFGFTAVPESHRLILRVREACNWVQSLEGVIDSAHSNFLHQNAIRPKAVGGSTVLEGAVLQRPSNDPQPVIQTKNTPYGFRYAAVRRPLIDPETYAYVRVTLFVAPFYAMFPAAAHCTAFQAFVPLDDEHTMYYYVQTRDDEPLDDATRERWQTTAGMRPGIDLNPDASKIRHAGNDWMQDRAAMRSGASFTGIFGVNNEDMVVQESMGPIYDRSKEHLGASDVAVIRMRRLMLDSLRAFEADGTAPLGLREPVAYRDLRAEERMVRHGEPWQRVGAYPGEPIETTATV